MAAIVAPLRGFYSVPIRVRGLRALHPRLFKADRYAVGKRRSAVTTTRSQIGYLRFLSRDSVFSQNFQRIPRPVPSPIKRMMGWDCLRFSELIVSCKRRLGSMPGVTGSGSSTRGGQFSSSNAFRIRTLIQGRNLEPFYQGMANMQFQQIGIPTRDHAQVRHVHWRIRRGR